MKSTITKMPEILSPAGNLEKLKFAATYGANAVYCALDKFGMRASADNFTLDELDEGIDFAHKRGVKVYLTVNTMPHECNMTALPEFLAPLKKITPDAFIVADIGVMQTIKKIIPDAVLHLSTQTSTVNAEACNFWHEYGIKRIVLARELSLDDIRLIRANVPDTLELEAFVHGSMCVSYSGRCLLSNYYTNRNANDGKCAQPCRWKYFINEEKRQNDVLSAEQDNNGTYIFSSKDLCMIEHASDLLSCGINSLKIEGRMKSVYYTACVTNIYKLALADAAENKPFNPLYFDEINGVSHREYCSGYFYSNPTDEANIVNTNEYLREKAFLCTITEYDVSTGLAKCIQRNKMSIGDKIQILSPGKLGKDIEILTLYDAEMAEIQSTPHAKMEFYARFSLPSNSSDIIRAK